MGPRSRSNIGSPSVIGLPSNLDVSIFQDAVRVYAQTLDYDESGALPDCLPGFYKNHSLRNLYNSISVSRASFLIPFFKNLYSKSLLIFAEQQMV
jgi:hypothetical protein